MALKKHFGEVFKSIDELSNEEKISKKKIKIVEYGLQMAYKALDDLMNEISLFLKNQQSLKGELVEAKKDQKIVLG